MGIPARDGTLFGRLPLLSLSLSPDGTCCVYVSITSGLVVCYQACFMGAVPGIMDVWSLSETFVVDMATCCALGTNHGSSVVTHGRLWQEWTKVGWKHHDERSWCWVCKGSASLRCRNMLLSFVIHSTVSSIIHHPQTSSPFPFQPTALMSPQLYPTFPYPCPPPSLTPTISSFLITPGSTFCIPPQSSFPFFHLVSSCHCHFSFSSLYLFLTLISLKG